MPGSLPIGCTLPTSGAAADPAAIGALAQTAEDLGFDSVWISDHVVVPEHISSAYPYSPDGRFPTLPTQPYLEPLATLGYLAGITRRVRLGIAVLILPYRHPLLTAKMVAKRFNVCTAIVYKLCAEGELRALRIGGALRFQADDVRRYLERVRP